jgi:oleate hydratase
LSIVLAHQPHFIGQPAEVDVFWGYGLFVDQVGNFVNKKMSDCTGEDILLELLGHLELLERRAEIVASANCIPCMMQFITSQFMPRHIGDRPQVCPPGTTDLAFIGQFCELPDDVVFTVEYSVGSAQTAVISLLGLSTHVSPLYKGQHDPVVVFGAMKALFN